VWWLRHDVAAVAEPTATPSAWLHQAHSHDIDELAAAQPDWQLQYEQLSRGRFDGAVQHVQLPGVRLVLETTSQALRQRGRMGHAELGFALGRAGGGAPYFHGQRVPADAIMIGRGDELDLTTPDAHQLIGLVVDQTLLGELWLRLYQKPWSSWLDRKLVVPARAGLADPLRALHLGLMRRLADAPALLHDSRAVLQWRDALLIEWLEALPERVDAPDLKGVEARRRVVQRACDHVLARPDEPVTLLQLCGEVGASPRKLDYCFRDVLGLSPAKVLRALRLNGVRRDLKRNQGPAATVHGVAARWGFWHMGAFSADYKRQFGELPSATRRRSGAAAG
jgi:AraC family ethanolamine operon transcriptional activator